MKVIVAGATGFIGKHLVRRLLGDGDEVVALTRDASKARAALPAGTKAVTWTPDRLGPWAESFDGAEAVVNLVGEVKTSRRWTEDDWAVMRASRVTAVEVLVEAMLSRPKGPRTIVSSSAISFYGDRGDELLGEDAAQGSDPIARVCAEGEVAALRAAERGVRPVVMRIGYVLERDGGPLGPVLPMFRWFVGARLGAPGQWIAWIHMADMTGFTVHALRNATVSGAYNLTAPKPVTAREFFGAVGRAMGRPCWIALGDGFLRWMLGDVAPVLLSSLRVVPTRTQASGYRFQYADVDAAMSAIVGAP